MSLDGEVLDRQVLELFAVWPPLGQVGLNGAAGQQLARHRAPRKFWFNVLLATDADIHNDARLHLSQNLVGEVAQGNRCLVYQCGAIEDEIAQEPPAPFGPRA